MFFSSARHKEIRSRQVWESVKISTPDVAKIVSQEWKALSPNEREVWEDMARRDKARFYMEKSLYQGPWKVQKGSKEKDPMAPKRPMPAFLSFSNAKRHVVKEQHPGLTTAESKCGKPW
jgi:hypothetical protein